MRSVILTVALLLIGCTGCDAEGTEAVYWTMTPGNIPVQVRHVELGREDGLEKLVPASVVEKMGDDAQLPPLADGDRRYAAVLTGCQQRHSPRLTTKGGRVTASFPEDEEGQVNCEVAEYYVAVFDVPR